MSKKFSIEIIEAPMTNNKQQTAVEWYIIKRDEIEMKSRLKLISPSEYEQELIKADEQAKEMEKEQIVKAVNKGWNYHEDGFVSWMGEQYYNETYGGGEQ